MTEPGGGGGVFLCVEGGGGCLNICTSVRGGDVLVSTSQNVFTTELRVENTIDSS
jgi:hypothetical protein